MWLKVLPVRARRNRSSLHEFLPFLPLRKRYSFARVNTGEEVQARALLAAASGDRLYALFVLALDTGMRQGEQFALEWGAIDFEAGSVQVQRSLEEINGRHRVMEPKSGKGRRIDVALFALEAL